MIKQSRMNGWIDVSAPRLLLRMPVQREWLMREAPNEVGGGGASCELVLNP